MSVVVCYNVSMHMRQHVTAASYIKSIVVVHQAAAGHLGGGQELAVRQLLSGQCIQQQEASLYCYHLCKVLLSHSMAPQPLTASHVSCTPCSAPCCTCTHPPCALLHVLLQAEQVYKDLHAQQVQAEADKMD
jgi:hypothetical protein